MSEGSASAPDAPVELTSDVLSVMKANARATWSAGHYPTIAERLEPASYILAEAAQVWGGDRVLDVGCGSGNTTIALAQRGGEVTGIDHTDAWFVHAMGRAKAAAVEVDLRQADAEDLPFDDGAFDVVASCFAHMFAPRHAVVAAEMARVLRPGGTLAVAVWDKQGEPAFDAMKKWLPTPPDGVGMPILWGDTDYLRAQFRSAGVKIDRVDLHDMIWEFSHRDEMMDWLFTASGPWIAMRDALQAAGLWDKAQAELAAAIDEHDVREDGTCGHHMRYLVAVGTRTAT